MNAFIISQDFVDHDRTWLSTSSVLHDVNWLSTSLVWRDVNRSHRYSAKGWASLEDSKLCHSGVQHLGRDA